ncbi:S-layer protein [Candidatus Methanomarinus sp.]|nr:S-layer protein [ANME-2 cluster archaeon]
MNKNNQCKNFFNRFWNYYKSNRSLLLIIIIIAALPTITVHAADNTQNGTNINVQFENEGINIIFDEVTKSGNTSVDTSSTGPDLLYGYDLVGEYRNITTTAKYTGNTSVCIDYSDTKIVDESALKLFHYETGESESIVYVRTGINAVDSTWDLASATHPSLLYYDFEEGDGCENLHFVINGHDGYTINGSDNNFLYNTSIYDKNGEPFIAWLGKQFCVIDNGVDWNISKVLIDENEDDTHLIEVGGSLNLPEGFAITLLEINDDYIHLIEDDDYIHLIEDDESLNLPEGFAISPLEINDGTNTLISITQNGDEVYNLTINESELFIYEEDLNASGIKDNWVLKFNVETVFKAVYGSGTVVINKIQLISPDVVTIRTPDSDLIPNYIITSQDSDETLQIKLNQPDDIIQLYKGSTVSFLDNSFHLRINKDGDSGAFVAKPSESETHGIFSQCQILPTGEIVPFALTSALDPSILYYDFDEGDGAEVLNFSVDVDNKQIKGIDNFLYETSIYDKDGKDFIAWLGEPYFVVGTGSDWYLSELLIDEDEDDSHLLEVGLQNLLEEELALTPVEIDINGEEVRFTLTIDGDEVDSSLIKEGNVYKYEEDLNESGYEDNTVLEFIVETVTLGNNTNFVKINSTQLVSTDILKVETPDSDLFDDFEVTKVHDDTLRIKFDEADDNITLKKGDTTSFLSTCYFSTWDYRVLS